MEVFDRPAKRKSFAKEVLSCRHELNTSAPIVDRPDPSLMLAEQRDAEFGRLFLTRNPSPPTTNHQVVSWPTAAKTQLQVVPHFMLKF